MVKQSSLLVAGRKETVNETESNPKQQLITMLGRDLTISCLLRLPRIEYDTVSSISRGFKSLIKSGEVYKLRREAGISEPWVYFSCNLMEWEAFDPSTNRWIRLPKMPFESCFAFSDKESLAVGTDILVFGREVNGPAVYRYSLLENKWTTTAQNLSKVMNTPRCLFASSAVGTTAYVAGGCTLDGDDLNSAEMYDGEKGTWTEIPSMNTARRSCAGVIMDGKFYVVGGTTKKGEAIRSAEVYDPVGMTWEVIPEMFPRAVELTDCPPLVAVVRNEMYAADPENMEVLKYSKEKNVWVSVGKMPEKVSTNKGWGVGFRACGDRLLVIGSSTDGESVLELNAWVPPAEGGGDGDGEPIMWEVIGKKDMVTFVYNCAIMGC